MSPPAGEAGGPPSGAAAQAAGVDWLRPADAADLNGGKDAGITWRHLASQTSGYRLVEPPGAARAYNDYPLALHRSTMTPSPPG